MRAFLKNCTVCLFLVAPLLCLFYLVYISVGLDVLLNSIVQGFFLCVFALLFTLVLVSCLVVGVKNVTDRLDEIIVRHPNGTDMITVKLDKKESELERAYREEWTDNTEYKDGEHGGEEVYD